LQPTVQTLNLHIPIEGEVRINELKKKKKKKTVQTLMVLTTTVLCHVTSTMLYDDEHCTVALLLTLELYVHGQITSVNHAPEFRDTNNEPSSPIVVPAAYVSASKYRQRE
jgi:hypothetical protein